MVTTVTNFRRESGLELIDSESPGVTDLDVQCFRVPDVSKCYRSLSRMTIFLEFTSWCWIWFQFWSLSLISTVTFLFPEEQNSLNRHDFQISRAPDQPTEHPTWGQDPGSLAVKLELLFERIYEYMTFDPISQTYRFMIQMIRFWKEFHWSPTDQPTRAPSKEPTQNPTKRPSLEPLTVVGGTFWNSFLFFLTEIWVSNNTLESDR